ncbi:MAG TPA: CotH kinase family protein [Solirubrobacterales bacterium]|nr:CotH kinase family protein [Solirubrobacterales bacterium]
MTDRRIFGMVFCIWLALSMAVATGLGAAPAALAAEDPAAAMYSPGTVESIDLDLSPAAVDALEAEPDEYVEGTFSLAPTDGTPGGVKAPLTPTPLIVGVRLKGNAGSSFRDLTEKAAFKIKFNEFVSGQKFLGLKKMTLNNMVEDPSMIHETLTYAAFRASGVPAPRTGYAYVRVNGDDFGIYLNIETLDDVALKKMFGDFDDETQHLYEGENGADVKPGGATDFEVDEGDEVDRGDLEALIAAANSAGPDWAAAVSPFADLQEMTRMWALDKYTGRWDGYAGEKRGVNQPNNYYLYSDPLGRFQMLPWGSDETWEEHLPFDGAAGLMFNRCLADAGCATAYWESLQAVRGATGGLGLDSLAANTASLLKPWQAIDPRKEVSAGEIAFAVGETRKFIAARPAEAGEWLAAHVPPATPATSPLPVPDSSTKPTRPINIGLPEALVRFRGVVARKGSIATRLRLLAAATVSQQGEISARGGAIRVCSDRARSTGPDSVTLRCRLPRAVRERLHRQSLELTIVTTVSAADGERRVMTRHLKLPRR